MQGEKPKTMTYDEAFKRFMKESKSDLVGLLLSHESMTNYLHEMVDYVSEDYEQDHDVSKLYDFVKDLRFWGDGFLKPETKCDKDKAYNIWERIHAVRLVAEKMMEESGKKEISYEKLVEISNELFCQ